MNFSGDTRGWDPRVSPREGTSKRKEAKPRNRAGIIYLVALGRATNEAESKRKPADQRSGYLIKMIKIDENGEGSKPSPPPKAKRNQQNKQESFK